MFIEARIGENPGNVPLNKLIAFYSRMTAEEVSEVGVMATVAISTYHFFKHIHSLIMNWNLEVGENVTIPEALAAAKKKQQELLAATRK